MVTRIETTQTSSHIPETAVEDPISIMNTEVHAILDGGYIDVPLVQSGSLSQQDIIVVRQLYGNNDPICE
ncbi:hypothetical protein ACFSTE_14515 [Aquimarina hainanensis]|uniref:Uncharacterized protein n=1 Tax=Aquimarina hainanensis TaxID=1578017 RepID=A0ABW5NAZ3_9FLAO|nr:hypothetical protein [Aquimarina sp. TRL1]QKX03601.1 hypothetical protein HN014_01285 [Aquimarina sp. TRL1]